MKATLTFTLPEETHEHRDALNGYQWRRSCECLRDQLRAWLKHGHTFKTPDEALEAVRTELNDLTSHLTQEL